MNITTDKMMNTTMDKVMESYEISDLEEKVLMIIKENDINIYLFNKNEDKNNPKEVFFITIEEFIKKSSKEKKIIKSNKCDIYVYNDIFTYCLKYNLFHVLNYIFVNYIRDTHLYINHQSNIYLSNIKKNILFDIDYCYSITFHIIQLIKRLIKLNDKDINNLFSGKKNILLLFTSFDILLDYDNVNLLLFNKYVDDESIKNKETYYSIYILYEFAKLFNSKIYNKLKKLGYDVVINSIIKKLINDYSQILSQDIYGIYGFKKSNELLYISLVLPTELLSNIHKKTFVMKLLNKISKDENYDENINTIIKFIIREISNDRLEEISKSILNNTNNNDLKRLFNSIKMINI